MKSGGKRREQQQSKAIFRGGSGAEQRTSRHDCERIKMAKFRPISIGFARKLVNLALDGLLATFSAPFSTDPHAFGRWASTRVPTVAMAVAGEPASRPGPYPKRERERRTDGKKKKFSYFFFLCEREKRGRHLTIARVYLFLSTALPDACVNHGNGMDHHHVTLGVWSGLLLMMRANLIVKHTQLFCVLVMIRAALTDDVTKLC